MLSLFSIAIISGSKTLANAAPNAYGSTEAALDGLEPKTEAQEADHTRAHHFNPPHAVGQPSKAYHHQSP